MYWKSSRQVTGSEVQDAEFVWSSETSSRFLLANLGIRSGGIISHAGGAICGVVIVFTEEGSEKSSWLYGLISPLFCVLDSAQGLLKRVPMRWAFGAL